MTFDGDLVGEAESQPEPCTDTATNVRLVQGRSPTPRSANHQVRLLVARAVQPPRGQLLVWSASGWRGSGVSSPLGRYREGGGGEVGRRCST